MRTAKLVDLGAGSPVPEALSQAASFPVYPVLFMVGFVLFQYVDVVVDGTQAARPIITGALMIVTVQSAIALVLKDGQRSAGTMMALLLLIAFGVSPLLLAITGIFLIRGGTQLWRTRWRHAPPGRLDWTRITRALNLVASLLLVVVIVNGIAAGAIGLPRIDLRVASQTAAPNAPDIYVILLDSYPRADELAVKFGVDNEPFLTALEDRGFQVGTRSRSNYSDTSLTLVSMLSMRMAHRIPALRPMFTEPDNRMFTEPDKKLRLVQRQLGESFEALEKLRGYGYEITAISPSIGQVGIRSADRHDAAGIDEFTLHLASVTAIGQVIDEFAPELWFDAFRHRSMESLDVLHGLAAGTAQRPRFVLTHLLLPHAPFVFGREGEPRPAPPCAPDCSPFDPPGPLTADMPAYWEQILYTNRLVLTAIDDILSVSRAPPVIIVMSDHGSRFFGAPENTHSLWAAHTPGKQAVFPDDGTPVNLFPRLLNAYFDAGLPLVQERTDAEGP